MSEAIIAFVRERLPEALRQSASVHAIRTPAADMEIRVSWPRPDGQNWSAVEVLSEQALDLSIRGRIPDLWHAVDRLVGEVNRLNRVAIDSLAERYGVSQTPLALTQAIARHQREIDAAYARLGTSEPAKLPKAKPGPKPKSAWDRLLDEEDLV